MLDLAQARQWLLSGAPALIITVQHTRGSVPRNAGTRMLVGLDAVAGTLGGGHLEWQAIARARQALAADSRHPAPFDWRVALGPSLGQCCGGEVTLHFEPLNAAALAAWPAPAARFVLQLYGAGHVGQAIVAVLAHIPCRVLWLDAREDAFPPPSTPLPTPLPSHIERLCSDPLEAEVDLAPPGAFHLVLTHDHSLDLRLAQTILHRQRHHADIGWFGLIGSATKRARFHHRLTHHGFTPTELATMHCPIGLPTLPGKEPGVIAVSVVAEMLMVTQPTMAPKPNSAPFELSPLDRSP
ncbi:xanthine dehydrogenase accessory protein XdhC [Leptothrix ochracea]|uniref:xanthine dehydrogenase accessory protein XdhC n=1 Tax=Leptothrix ochracea TaxID=735331 RepID=UPI0034E19D51